MLQIGTICPISSLFLMQPKQAEIIELHMLNETTIINMDETWGTEWKDNGIDFCLKIK